MFSGILTATTRPLAQILPLADSVSLTTTFLPDTSSILPRISNGKLGKPDQDDGEQGFSVPLVVGEDVEVVEHKQLYFC